MSPDPEADLVDRIAQDLPADVRAAYYRELNHCRSLPESDEMLRILRAMQFLTLLMRQVPDKVRWRLPSLTQFVSTVATVSATGSPGPYSGGRLRVYAASTCSWRKSPES